MFKMKVYFKSRLWEEGRTTVASVKIFSGAQEITLKLQPFIWILMFTESAFLMIQ